MFGTGGRGDGGWSVLFRSRHTSHVYLYLIVDFFFIYIDMDNVFACNAPLSGLIMPKAPIAHNN